MYKRTKKCLRTNISPGLIFEGLRYLCIYVFIVHMFCSYKKIYLQHVNLPINTAIHHLFQDLCYLQIFHTRKELLGFRLFVAPDFQFRL